MADRRSPVNTAWVTLSASPSRNVSGEPDSRPVFITHSTIAA
ncbi:hypothetical protein ACFFMR_02840 [Micromonospora andamanensis]|nr:hypothetical protein [Micromonospora andamanensis]